MSGDGVSVVSWPGHNLCPGNLLFLFFVVMPTIHQLGCTIMEKVPTSNNIETLLGCLYCLIGYKLYSYNFTSTYSRVNAYLALCLCLQSPLVGAFSVIVKICCKTDGSSSALLLSHQSRPGSGPGHDDIISSVATQHVNSKHTPDITLGRVDLIIEYMYYTIKINIVDLR